MLLSEYNYRAQLEIENAEVRKFGKLLHPPNFAGVVLASRHGPGCHFLGAMQIIGLTAPMGAM